MPSTKTSQPLETSTQNISLRGGRKQKSTAIHLFPSDQKNDITTTRSSTRQASKITSAHVVPNHHPSSPMPIPNFRNGILREKQKEKKRKPNPGLSILLHRLIQPPKRPQLDPPTHHPDASTSVVPCGLAPQSRRLWFDFGSRNLSQPPSEPHLVLSIPSLGEGDPDPVRAIDALQTNESTTLLFGPPRPLLPALLSYESSDGPYFFRFSPS